MSDAPPPAPLSNLGPRVQPFYCPYCCEEDFVPSGPLDGPDGEFHCRSCDRRFRVTFLGIGAPAEDDQEASAWASDTR